MNWANVKLILLRELRDQLRDRRTLFMIAILPIFLYPLIGMSFLQIAQFMQEHATKVKVIGSRYLPEDPAFVNDKGFATSLVPEGKGNFVVSIDNAENLEGDVESLASAKEQLSNGEFDAVIYFSSDFSEQLALHQQGESEIEAPQPEVYFTSAKDRSRIAYERINVLLSRWRSKIVEESLSEKGIPATTATPFAIRHYDVAEESGRKAAIWSKILPFIIIIWALTGAFYPAIDLCAGEKERGTLETLLCCPAERTEIVWGKLITIMIFSMATSLLNLISMVVTAAFIFSRITIAGSEMAAIGTPPLATIWLIVVLVPLSALFSALSLALATMAGSSKEGQYYLMPLMLVTMPLAMIPILPSTELNLGTSLIPVTGAMLLLKSLMEGDYIMAMKFSLPVIGVTSVCCLFAIRWAVNQFSNENVLFRESERFELGLWIVHLVRDRQPTPSVMEAFMCGILLLIIRFFAGLLSPVPNGWNGFMISTIVVQFAFILAPVLIMAVVLTQRPKRTLLIQTPSLANILMAVILAFFIHPAATALAHLLQTIYPVSESTMQQLAGLSEIIASAPVWQLLITLALVPAICEEFAFRGFILSGLRKIGSRGMAILISSVFFGVMHGLLQQSITASFLGLLLGYIAIQTKSILPCMLFHLTHNALQVLSSLYLTAERVAQNSRLASLLVESNGGYSYNWRIVSLSLMISVLVVYWFQRLPFEPSEEERLQNTLDQQSNKAASQVY